MMSTEYNGRIRYSRIGCAELPSTITECLVAQRTGINGSKQNPGLMITSTFLKTELPLFVSASFRYGYTPTGGI